MRSRWSISGEWVFIPGLKSPSRSTWHERLRLVIRVLAESLSLARSQVGVLLGVLSLGSLIGFELFIERLNFRAQCGYDLGM